MLANSLKRRNPAKPSVQIDSKRKSNKVALLYPNFLANFVRCYGVTGSFLVVGLDNIRFAES